MSQTTDAGLIRINCFIFDLKLKRALIVVFACSFFTMVDIDVDFEEEDIWTLEGETWLGTIGFINFNFLDTARLDSTLIFFRFWLCGNFDRRQSLVIWWDENM